MELGPCDSYEPANVMKAFHGYAQGFLLIQCETISSPYQRAKA
jgi:hypothetical protein